MYKKSIIILTICITISYASWFDTLRVNKFNIKGKIKKIFHLIRT